jgi:hypothetical protein
MEKVQYTKNWTVVDGLYTYYFFEMQCEWFKHELILMKTKKDYFSLKKSKDNLEVPLHPLNELGYYIPSSLFESGSDRLPDPSHVGQVNILCG